MKRAKKRCEEVTYKYTLIIETATSTTRSARSYKSLNQALRLSHKNLWKTLPSLEVQEYLIVKHSAGMAVRDLDGSVLLDCYVEDKEC